MKKTKLQEWILVLKDKNDWKKVLELSSTHLVYMSPSSLRVLAYIIKYIDKLSFSDFKDNSTFFIKSRIKLSDKQWGDANSEISKSCTNYKLISIMMDDDYVQLKLQQYFQDNGMVKLTETTTKKNAKMLNDSSINHSYKGSLKTRFHELEHINIKNKNNRKGAMDLGDLDEAIELFYHENKLKIICEKISRASFQIHVLSDDEKHWVNKIPHAITQYPQVTLYALTHEMILKDSKECFDKLKYKLEEYLKKGIATKMYLKNFYEYLLVFCTRKINSGDFKYSEDFLTVFSEMLNKGIMYDQGNLPSWRFKNVIKGASKLLWLENANNESIFKQMDDFIDEHEDKLIEESRIPIVNYCRAFVDYLRGDYEKSENILRGTEVPKDDLIKIEYYFLLMFIYLENNQRDEFITASENLTSMLHYSKKKLSELSIKRRTKAISFVKKVQKNSESTRSSHFQDCLNEIQDTENFFGKDWLIAYLKRKLAGT